MPSVNVKLDADEIAGDNFNYFIFRIFGNTYRRGSVPPYSMRGVNGPINRLLEVRRNAAQIYRSFKLMGCVEFAPVSIGLISFIQ